MSIIKVGIKIRSPSEREIKVKKEEKWVTTDKNSLQCVDFLNPCHFTFGRRNSMERKWRVTFE